LCAEGLGPALRAWRRPAHRDPQPGPAGDLPAAGLCPGAGDAGLFLDADLVPQPGSLGARRRRARGQGRLRLMVIEVEIAPPICVSKTLRVFDRYVCAIERAREEPT